MQLECGLLLGLLAFLLSLALQIKFLLLGTSGNTLPEQGRRQGISHAYDCNRQRGQICGHRSLTAAGPLCPARYAPVGFDVSV